MIKVDFKCNLKAKQVYKHITISIIGFEENCGGQTTLTGLHYGTE